MRFIRFWLVCSLLVATVAHANTPTDTPTPTATATATNTPVIPTPLVVPLTQQSMTVHLFDSITAAGPPSGAVQVDAFPYVTVQVSDETGTCSSLSLNVVGSNDGGHWAPIPINGGNATITETDVPVLTTEAWSIPAGFKYLAVVPLTVSSCQVSVILQANR